MMAQPITTARADLFGTAVFVLIGIVWLWNAISQGARSLRRRTSPLAAPAAVTTTRGRPANRRVLSPLSAMASRLTPRPAGTTAQEAGTAMRLPPIAAETAQPRPPISQPAQMKSFASAAPAPARAGLDLEAASTPGRAFLLQPFFDSRRLAEAVVAAIVLEPCAAHKGAGHEPEDW
ncbi:MAG: hypothetical protein GIW99_10365 [Candidatus Eremiobacteraeota bacterium]|nr:hypothetical protein [Candidatus Eremiobacteraeota bacterium]MBC5828065.1 hypothetical protein [Candidatus Eremiobacteraeota bacterium]